MTPERWKELVCRPDLELTLDEQKEGWMFCYDWDGMLLNPNSSFECSECYLKEECLKIVERVK